MIIDSMREFIKGCPLLKKGKINANYLGEKAVSYSIDTVPAEPVVRKYPDGGSMRQALFIFASREIYGEDTLDNLDAGRFYEEFAAWMEGEDEARRYPQLGEGMEPLRLEILTGGYVHGESAGSARYQIQFRLIYNKE